jgi:hypothetical protein
MEGKFLDAWILDSGGGHCTSTLISNSKVNLDQLKDYFSISFILFIFNIKKIIKDVECKRRKMKNEIMGALIIIDGQSWKLDLSLWEEVIFLYVNVLWISVYRIGVIQLLNLCVNKLFKLCFNKKSRFTKKNMIKIT